MGIHEGTDDQVVVRKYGNRRLYRTDESRYVTLDELAGLVRDEIEFNVLDAKSGEDLTGVVLAQVILEEAKRTKGLAFPTQLLRQLIRLHDPDLREFLVDHLPRLVQVYLEAKAATSDGLDLVASAEAEVGEAIIIAQLAAVKKQLTHILDALEVEDISDE